MKMRMKNLFFVLLMGVLPMQAQITMNIDATQRGPEISPYQYGLFFEEINHAGDGGLYAELIRNRSFEDNITFDNATVPEYWMSVGDAGLQLVTDDLLNDVQEKCMKIYTTTASADNLQGAANSGFWGMNIVSGKTYRLSLWVKGSNSGYTGNLMAQLQTADGLTVCGETILTGEVAVGEWRKLTATITATASDPKGRFALLTSNNGSLFVDVVSLFPETWKGRENGMRPDLAQLLADTKPTFLRFPGGCYVEGTNGFENAFQWKKTIGPIEGRNGHQNVNWGYRSSDGLGYDEYLQLCEDLGAAPMFVVNVGLGHGYIIPMEDLDTLVQNTLDAIEYANGDASTVWGARRIANGHAEPYGLKFVEIGNENYQANSAQQSQDYAERYYKFYKAIKEKYPEIITIGNVEAWGTDNPSWRNDYPVELVDEHYYRSNTWMRNNYHKYDNYDRSIGVYNGEYAANETGTYGTYGNMNSALGEAVYMLGMEKNSDVCRMASFAPIFTHVSDPRWPYDMIHFDAEKTFVTPSYYVQKLMANNLGKENLLWTESGNALSEVSKIGIGTWNTSVYFDDVKVVSGEDVLIDDDFSTNSGWTDGTGTWNVVGRTKRQTNTNLTNCTSINDTEITTNNYTLTLRARKNSGTEGFLVLFNYQDAKNYTWWNIGGWSNSKHGLETCRDGVKTTVTSTSGTITSGQWYQVKIEVNGAEVKCYLNDELIHSVTLPSNQAVYQSAQLDEEQGVMILKVVNPNAVAQTLNLNLSNMTATGGTVIRMTAEKGTSENSLANPDVVKPQEEETLSSVKTLEIPAFSLNIFRINVTDVAEGQHTSSTIVYEQEDAGKSYYLYAHMNASREITNYAVSRYGSVWTDLLNSAEVFDTKAKTVTGGMRDAYVLRMQNGKFMLAGTDMTSRLGWESNHIMDFMVSNDLIHWDKEMKIDLESEGNLAALGLSNADEMKAAWAPQVIYDPVTGCYMAYYSVGFPDRHRIYYQLLDEELNVLTEPRLLFDPGYDVIDADIVWNDIDQRYVMIYKWEGVFHLYQAVATQLVPTDKTTGTCQWTILPEFDIYENGQGIEGASLYRPIGSKQWKMAYMNYSGGGYKVRNLDEHCMNPSAGTVIKGTVQPQHGSFLKLTEREYQHLRNWEALKTLLPSMVSKYKESQNETIGQAVTKAQTALANSGTFDEEYQAMEEALQELSVCNEIYERYLREQALAGNPTDFTPLIINPDFSQESTGWEGTTFTAVDGLVAEQFNKTFDFYQILEDMPAGKYELAVQGFYRYGLPATAYDSHVNGTEQLLAELYVQDVASTPIMSLYAEDDYTSSPYTYPDNMTQAEEAFGHNDLYYNKLSFNFKGGSLRFGIRKDSIQDRDWTCFDNFKLRFIEPTTGIDPTSDPSQGRGGLTPNPSPNGEGSIYDLQGRRVNNGQWTMDNGQSLNSGIYIANGNKVVIK